VRAESVNVTCSNDQFGALFLSLSLPNFVALSQGKRAY